MASPVPAKSHPQPLYNFSLPRWKLTKNHTNNHHRGRRGTDSSSQQLASHDSVRRRSPGRRQSPLLHSVHRQSPMRDSASESESNHAAYEIRKNSLPPQAHSGKNGDFASSSPCSSDHQTVKANKQREVIDHDRDEGKESRSKIYIRLKTPSKNKKEEDGNPGIEIEGTEVEESMAAKTWNLRPRKAVRKQINTNGGGNLSVRKSSSPENKGHPPSTLPKRSEMRSAPQAAAAATVQKEKKRKFSISLSRDEIEEDIYAIIGTKPNRRPKKRSKMIQRQLDSLYPGLWLSSITPDAYKVSEIPTKG